MDDLKVILNEKKTKNKRRVSKRSFWVRIISILGVVLMFLSVLASVFYYIKMS